MDDLQDLANAARRTGTRPSRAKTTKPGTTTGNEKTVAIVAVVLVLILIGGVMKMNEKVGGAAQPAGEVRGGEPRVGMTVAEVRELYRPAQIADERFWDVSDGDGNSVEWGIMTVHHGANENRAVSFKGGRVRGVKVIRGGKYVNP